MIMKYLTKVHRHLDQDKRIPQKSLYGEKDQFMKQGDKIEMILNMKEGTLRYIVNDKDYGIAFEDIDKTKKYRLAVRLNNHARKFVFQLY